MAKSSDAAEVRRAHRSELSPLRFLERSVLVYPGKVAVVHEDRRYTYREFGERVKRLASALRAAGLQKGRSSSVHLPQHPGAAGSALRGAGRWRRAGRAELPAERS